MFKSKTSLAAGTAAALLLSFGSVETNAAGAVVVVRPVLRPVVRAVHVVRRPVPSGISAGEAARIRHQIHEHHQMQRVANADGEITRREQAWLARDAAQVRHLIQTAKTN
ncbi:MAG TPA: hypothetical protein VGO41_10015 [Steroidobacteraceae bacterium]|jgi:hypothetical protein|nr:hypothetical protein [Steroidobacteraceae bacterium]